jgi:hypothetical protein
VIFHRLWSLFASSSPTWATVDLHDPIATVAFRSAEAALLCSEKKATIAATSFANRQWPVNGVAGDIERAARTNAANIAAAENVAWCGAMLAATVGMSCKMRSLFCCFAREKMRGLRRRLSLV